MALFLNSRLCRCYTLMTFTPGVSDLPLFTPFTPPNSTFDKRDSTKNLCFYSEFGIEWFWTGRSLLLYGLCTQSRSKRWFQESSEQPSAVHGHSSGIPPFPVLPVVRRAVPSAFASDNWPPARYGNTSCEYNFLSHNLLSKIHRYCNRNIRIRISHGELFLQA